MDRTLTACTLTSWYDLSTSPHAVATISLHVKDGYRRYDWRIAFVLEWYMDTGDTVMLPAMGAET